MGIREEYTINGSHVFSSKTDFVPPIKARTIQTRDNSVNTKEYIIGYVTRVAFAKNGYAKLTKIETAENPKANESHIRKFMKTSFFLKIAKPSLLLNPPGTWKAAAKVTVAMIVATSKLTLTISLKSSCLRSLANFLSFSSEILAASLPALTFVSSFLSVSGFSWVCSFVVCLSTILCKGRRTLCLFKCDMIRRCKCLNQNVINKINNAYKLIFILSHNWLNCSLVTMSLTRKANRPKEGPSPINLPTQLIEVEDYD